MRRILFDNFDSFYYSSQDINPHLISENIQFGVDFTFFSHHVFRW
jgi:hypothetical protein